MKHEILRKVVVLDMLYRDPSCSVVLCLDVTHLSQSIPLWERNPTSHAVSCPIRQISGDLQWLTVNLERDQKRDPKALLDSNVHSLIKLTGHGIKGHT